MPSTQPAYPTYAGVRASSTPPAGDDGVRLHALHPSCSALQRSSPTTPLMVNILTTWVRKTCNLSDSTFSFAVRKSGSPEVQGSCACREWPGAIRLPDFRTSGLPDCEASH
jgi:hypothetical protein